MRRRNRNLWVVIIVVIILLGLVYASNNGGIINSLKSIQVKLSSTTDYNSIKDVTQNKGEYLGKTIKIKGEFGADGLGNFLSDNNGYYFYVGKPLTISNSCIEANRVYEKGNYYTAKGKIAEYSDFFNTYSYIDCSEPLY